MAKEPDWEGMERRLWAEVNRDHPDWPEERKRAFVFGSKRRAGWKPSREQ
jgi:hypothetical protein